MTRGRKPSADGPTERILAVLRSLGTDRDNRPVSIYTAELAERAQVNHGSMAVLGKAMEARGLVVRCLVQPAAGNARHAWRMGPGMPVPAFVPLNTKRAGVAMGQPGKPMPVTTPASATSTPCATEPATPVFLQTRATTPQAQVGNSASRHAGSPLDTPPAGSAATALGISPAQTPKPDAGAALKKEPATRKASAGDAIRLAISKDGSLQVGDVDDPARWVFTPDQVMAIGYFLHLTERVWRP